LLALIANSSDAFKVQIVYAFKMNIKNEYNDQAASFHIQEAKTDTRG